MAPVDLNVFPEAKIKLQLRRNPKFGRIVDTTLQSVRVGSALLIHGMVDEILDQRAAQEKTKKDASTAEASTSSLFEPKVIGLEDIQELIRQHQQDYFFVNSARIHQLTESDAVKRSSKRQRRTPAQQRKDDDDNNEQSNNRGGNKKKLPPPLYEALALAEQQNTASSRDLIVEDEDDYD